VPSVSGSDELLSFTEPIRSARCTGFTSLKHRRDFNHIYRRGRRLSGRAFSLRFVDAGLTEPRVGFAIKKKLVMPSLEIDYVDA
jgi:hypothetical protein